MNRCALILAVVILPAWVLPAPADGIFGFFGKKAKVNPNERVPELIATLKTEQDERKRSAAAAELATCDAAAHAEIVPMLVDVLQSDPKSGVRMDVASSLGSLRPVSQMAGQALEKAASSDDNLRVRWHVKGIVLKYRMAGYSAGKPDHGPNASKTSEPPLLEPGTAMRVPNPRQEPALPVPYPARTTPAVNTSLTNSAAAPPGKGDVLEFRPSVPRPLPQGPSFSTALPQQPFRLAPPPAPLVDDGPPLTPPPPASNAQNTNPPPAPF